VDLGGLTAVIEHYPGHSGTDMIVRVPEQNVVYTGDLLFNGYFPLRLTSSHGFGLARNVGDVCVVDKDTLFVPGHGQLCGQEAIAMFRSTFDDIEEQAMSCISRSAGGRSATPVRDTGEIFQTIDIHVGFSIGPTIRKMYADWTRKSELKAGKLKLGNFRRAGGTLPALLVCG